MTNADLKSKQNTSKTQKWQTKKHESPGKLDFLVDSACTGAKVGESFKTTRKKKDSIFPLKHSKTSFQFYIPSQGHATLLCIAPICTDDHGRESKSCAAMHARQGGEREKEGERERKKERKSNNPTKNQQNPPPPKKKISDAMTRW